MRSDPLHARADELEAHGPPTRGGDGSTPPMERRAFLRKAGLGAAVAGAAWVAPSVVGFDVAFAGASCNQQDTLNWGAFATGASFTSQTFPAVGSYPAVTVTLSVVPVLTPTPVTGNQTVWSETYGGQSNKFWKMFMNNNRTAEGYNATFTFSVPVYNLRFSLFDIDRYDAGNGTGFQDVVWLTGAAFTATKPGAGNVVIGNGTTASPWTGTGTASVPGNSNDGNVNVVMATASAFTVNYRSGDLFNAQQSIGIGNLVFCR